MQNQNDTSSFDGLWQTIPIDASKRAERNMFCYMMYWCLCVGRVDISRRENLDNGFAFTGKVKLLNKPFENLREQIVQISHIEL